MPNRKEIEVTFCLLMSQAWVAGAQEVELPDLPGLKSIVVEDGPWRLLDAYCRTSGDRNWGFTTLTCDGVVALTMSYGGSYRRAARSFLKNVLREAYEGEHFQGGRGLPVHQLGRLRYHNDVRTDPNDELLLIGRETIYEWASDHHLEVPSLMGFHVYTVMIFPS